MASSLAKAACWVPRTSAAPVGKQVRPWAGRVRATRRNEKPRRAADFVRVLCVTLRGTAKSWIVVSAMRVSTIPHAGSLGVACLAASHATSHPNHL